MKKFDFSILVFGVILLGAGIGLSVATGTIMILERVVPITLLGLALVLEGSGVVVTVFSLLVAWMNLKNENRVQSAGKVTSEVSGDES